MKNENNTQHTPGPWELSITLPCRDSKSEPTGVFYLNITHNGSIVTKCLSKDKNKLVANARLIASAPDLLRALKIAVKHIKNIQEKYKPEQPFALGTYTEAIAKAEGKTLGVS